MQFGSPAGGGNPPPDRPPPWRRYRYYVLLRRRLPVHHGHLSEDAMKKKDSTEVMRVRQSAGRNKVSLIVCAVAAIIGVVGWLSTL
jgi:hypothetical protein